MIRNDVNDTVKRFSQRLKTSWQVVFITMVVIYGISLYHALSINPPIRENLLEYVKNMDLISFLIAIILAIVILNLKRKYFSKKFTRNITESALSQSAELSDQELLRIVFTQLQKKMYFIWLLGFLIVLDGVLLYWIIFLGRNMHIYFIVGAFSLILNYPRRELFEEIPWHIREIKREKAKGKDERTSE